MIIGGTNDGDIIEIARCGIDGRDGTVEASLDICHFGKPSSKKQRRRLILKFVLELWQRLLLVKIPSDTNNIELRVKCY